MLRRRGDAIRQRKGQKSKEEVEVEPLDESDQARIVQNLRAESAKQQESILQLFGYLSGVACVLVIAAVVYLDQWHVALLPAGSASLPLLRPLSLGHGLGAAVLHGVSPGLIQHDRTVSPVIQVLVALDALLAASILWVSRALTASDETLLWTHYGLVASNIFTLGSALLLRWDSATTDQTLHDLVQAQYRYKSL